jgi:hypothetical protein
MRVLAMRVGLALGESEEVSEKARRTKIAYSEAAAHALAELAEASDTLAMQSEWMWAVARSIERGEQFCVYAYATRLDDQWLVDMHFVAPGEPPCFGLEAPHIFIPVSAVFAFVYFECKKLLGIEDRRKGQRG